MEDEVLYMYLSTPNTKDPISNLDRKDHCNFFGLRSGYVMLNGHRNRIDPLVPTMCRNCGWAYEAVEHLLLHSANLRELGHCFLP